MIFQLFCFKNLVAPLCQHIFCILDFLAPDLPEIVSFFYILRALPFLDIFNASNLVSIAHNRIQSAMFHIVVRVMATASYIIIFKDD